jgi:superfamily I DNA/RNA helicase
MMLAFNASAVKDLKDKVEKLGKRTGRDLRHVWVRTFHSLGLYVVKRRLGREPTIDDKKSHVLARELWGDDTLAMYEDFVCDLVAFAKGQGVGVLCPDEAHTWRGIVDHHDLYLDSEEASVDTAIALARGLYKRSEVVARERALIDYDDMLLLPLVWNLRFYAQARVYTDESQDTNPTRRALAKKLLMPGGRLFAVGDRHQSIYGFTGASHDAMDLIRAEFNCAELPLTVSYRCPKASEAEVAHLVPGFRVHESAQAGRVIRSSVEDALPLFDDRAAILCRNTAPLISLAYGLMSRRIACQVAGREMGKGLIGLIKKMRAKTIDALREKLAAYRDREVDALMAKGKEQKAAGIADRVECVETFIEALAENERTVPKLIAAVEALFARGDGVTLSTIHKAKGREWRTVCLYRTDLMPSPFARQAHQHQQELNLEYVAKTRFQETMVYLDGELGAKKKIVKQTEMESAK